MCLSCTEEVDKLFGVLLAAARPQSTPFSSCKDHAIIVLSIVHGVHDVFLLFGLKVVCRDAMLRQALAFVYEVTNIKRPSQSFIMFLMLINLNSLFFRYFASDNIVVFKSLVSRV